MPTPFYHLSLAQEIINHERLSPSLKKHLEEHSDAFFLGNVAPDVQVVSGQPRAQTHFFDLPLRTNTQPPWDAIWLTYPQLRQAKVLPPEQSAFLAGYLCHLQADWLWINDIFVPVFGLRCLWGTFEERLKLHNVLRAYLDQQILSSLPPQTITILRSASPSHWLPFVSDDDLRDWRDRLASQLAPGNKVATVEVFAARQGLNPQELYQLLSSEQAMDEMVFCHIPRRELSAFRPNLIRENLALLNSYLSLD